MSLSIVLADDHQMVREGLRSLLEDVEGFKVVGEAADGRAVAPMVAELQPDVLVLDLMMPGLNGLDIARLVCSRKPHPAVVVLSMHSNEAYVLETLRAGALAYVLKDAGVDCLIQAIHSAVAGIRYLSAPLNEAAIEAYATRLGSAASDPYQLLTAREREVLQLTTEGQSCTEIADRLFISARTVENHRANLMRKLGVRNQKELVRYAVERRTLLGQS
jgi:two-component system, NarL family, response regulator NreC